jgi:hypothetical protein
MAFQDNRETWFRYYGCYPPEGMEVDHINRDPSDNRKENLRLATHRQNLYNSTYPNQWGCKGVTLDVARNKWRAQIRIDGRKVNLGRYETFEEAAEAYRKAATELHGEFLCLNPLRTR